MSASAAAAKFRGKAWCFTINNPSPSSMKDFEPDSYEYLVYGREKAPGTGTEHLQGYVVFKDRKRMSECKKVSGTAHWEPAKGTPLQASTYCKKDGDFVEEGVLPAATGQLAGPTAAAAKWAAIKSQAIAGDIESVEGSAYVQHYRTLQAIANDHAPMAVDLSDVCGLWYVGPPGCGKSHAARHLTSAEKLYLKPMNKWWDGFNPRAHQVVLLEDLDSESQTWMGHYLKIWADKWRFAAEKKGSTVQIRPQQLVVTSNYTIEQLWSSDEAMVKALKRRFTVTNFPAASSPFSVMSSLVQAVQHASAVEPISALPSPPTPTGLPRLHRQNAQIFTRETVGEQFEWEDADQSQRMPSSQDDDTDY